MTKQPELGPNPMNHAAPGRREIPAPGALVLAASEARPSENGEQLPWTGSNEQHFGHFTSYSTGFSEGRTTIKNP